jgi:leucyl aminopeptidase (aminopeptidase T)
MHIRLTSGVPIPYTIGQLRRDNPQVSFPRVIPDDTLAEYDVYPVAETPAPEITHAQNVAEAFEQIGGVWTQTWTVTDASADEIAQRVGAQWREVRAERNARLSACDWTQLADAHVSAVAWANYRQALRDLPQVQEDPFNIVWPDEP